MLVALKTNVAFLARVRAEVALELILVYEKLPTVERDVFYTLCRNSGDGKCAAFSLNLNCLHRLELWASATDVSSYTYWMRNVIKHIAMIQKSLVTKWKRCQGE